MWAGVLGAIIGSFLNVVILRDKRRETIVTGRSECPQCKHELQWYELIPILSFVLQAGRCRNCKKPISWQYPLVEAITAALAMFALWYGYIEHNSWVLVAGLFIAFACFVVLSGTDLRTMEVRPEYTIVAALAAGLAQYLSSNLRWTDIILGAAIGAGLILFLSYGWKLLTGRLGMGEGDAWIAGAVGALVGYPVIFASLFAAVSTGAVVGILLALRQRKGLAIEMPFGPFLILGGLLALIWGQRILDWYIL
jgi:leader peptidase (prepilin peptidase)/N-methyltransferase